MTSDGVSRPLVRLALQIIVVKGSGKLEFNGAEFSGNGVELFSMVVEFEEDGGGGGGEGGWVSIHSIL